MIESERIDLLAKTRVTKQEKDNTFLRSLAPNSTMTKTVTLPAKTVDCDCVILDSDPE